MNYSYVLLSEKEKRFYIGSTRDLRKRMEAHNNGRVPSTAYRRPLRLVYYETCLSAADASRRERYLKTGRGGRYLKQRLATWLFEIRSNKLERH
jgi:putative endonuclease